MTFKCPKCSSEYTKGAKFCQSCGNNLELEFIENPVCPRCKATYPANTRFCIKDGYRLVRPEDLVPKCVICNTAYPDDTKFCPLDGGEVKISLPFQTPQPNYQKPLLSGYDIYGKYPKASLGNRFVAALLDGSITLGLSIPAILFFIAAMDNAGSYGDEPSPGLLLGALLFYMIPIVYSLIKDGLGQGQSWGKRAVDLMVVNLDNNTACDKSKSFFRNIISGLVAVIPFVGWIIEPIMVLATEDGRKLGDKAANTQVVDKKIFI